jgi:hypothetical protein
MKPKECQSPERFSERADSFIQTRIKRLKKFENIAVVASAVRTRLMGCCRSAECEAAICPIASFNKQALFAKTAKPYFDALRTQNADELVAVSIVDSGMLTLRMTSFEEEVLRLRALIKRAPEHFQMLLTLAARANNGVCHAIGGVDISFNSSRHLPAAFADHWSAHAWVVMLKAEFELIEPSLRSLLSRDAANRRPLLAKSCDGELGVYRYSLKPNFFARYTVSGKDSTTARPLQTTKQHDLPLRAEVVLLCALAGQSTFDRAIIVAPRDVFSEAIFNLLHR